MTPGHPDVRVVDRHLIALRKALATLRRHAGVSSVSLDADAERRWAVERGLQLCAQNALDIASHISSAVGLDPGNYGSSIDCLVEAGALPRSFGERFPGHRRLPECARARLPRNRPQSDRHDTVRTSRRLRSIRIPRRALDCEASRILNGRTLPGAPGMFYPPSDPPSHAPREHAPMNPTAANVRTVYPPTGPEITAKSWLTEAPMRMLMNNLHPDVAEKPKRAGGLWRPRSCGEDLGRLRPHRGHPEAAERGRDAAGAIRQAGGGVPYTPRRAPGAGRELEPGSALGQLGSLQRARSQGARHVRPDDGGVVDLHRQPGDRAGHLRDLRRGRTKALRRRPGRALDPDRGARGHGRGAAARGGDGRSLLPGGGVRPGPH